MCYAFVRWSVERVGNVSYAKWFFIPKIYTGSQNDSKCEENVHLGVVHNLYFHKHLKKLWKEEAGAALFKKTPTCDGMCGLCH